MWIKVFYSSESGDDADKMVSDTHIYYSVYSILFVLLNN